MIGLTPAIGQPWIDIAVKAAVQMEEMTGIICHPVLQDFNTVHPSWNKTRLAELYPNHNEYFIFDADIICLKHWNPTELFCRHDRALLCVPDRNNERVEEECVQHGIPFPDRYINAGLTIFGREHLPIWEAVWKMHPFKKGWLEQTPLNMVLKQYENNGGKVVRLDRKYNRITGWQSLHRAQADDTVNAHLAGNGEKPERILKAWEGLK
jgi:lipopolysaccharide biosynthesis glycosyltransferase